jgi:tetratricopeptide (TPR) repeat protein
MTAFPHTRFLRFRPNPLTHWLIWLLLLGAFMSSTLEAQDGAAEEDLLREEFDRAKWDPNPLSEELYLLSVELLRDASPPISMSMCWTCGLWAKESPSFPGVPEETREALLFNRARCFRALGMRKEALEGCREILRQYPAGNTVPQALESIVEILFAQGNYKAVANLLDHLDPAHRERLLPASVYLIAQSFYILGQDAAAAGLLERVPPDAEIYPYALYTLAQVFYRQGDADRALSTIRAVHDAQPDARVPEMLKEMAWLTQARMLFQQGSYGEAIQGFRTLRRSSFFLPEALMGTGWCYKKMENFSKAIAYFQAVQASYADADTLTEARMELAHIFSVAKMYEDSFENYRTILNDLHSRISQYQKYGGDPEWLTWLVERWLDSPKHFTETPDEAPVMDQEGDLPEEMEPILQKKKYTSSRMKALLGIREGLEQVALLYDKLANPVPPDRTKRAVVSASYPPLGETLPHLEPGLAGLLDFDFALLDTEYRLIHSGSMLGLLNQAEREALMRDCLAFYRTELEALLLPQRAEQDAYDALTLLQGTVRHLSFSLEQKERVLAKIVFLKHSLKETEAIMEQWAKGVDAVSTSETQPTRFLLLEKWMTLVRVFLYLRSWDVRSPAVFMLDDASLAAYRPSPILSSQEALDRKAERIDTVWQRLATLVEREVQNLHLERLEVLEALLVRAQFDYADALVKEQERILKSLKVLPSDMDSEEAPDTEKDETEDETGEEKQQGDS